MKISAFFHAILQNDKIILKANDPRDMFLIQKLFRSKADRENRTHKEILVKTELDAAFQHITFKQRNAVFKLVEVIFMSESENHRKPTEQEKYELYLDLLELYADRIPNRYTNQLRVIHVSESNTMAGAHLISGLLYHLNTMCNLTTDLEADIRQVLYAWEIWRGNQEHDFSDDISVEELRERIRFSEASGRQPVEFHHIISRGACPQAIEKAWNLVALTDYEHKEFHDIGINGFLEKYPHLKNRFERAKNKCSELINNSNKITDLSKIALESE